jgi:septal ring factor EnvC (AmiA/AmiB activator)
VVPHDFGTAETEAEPAATEAANEEFRGAVWPLYEQAARAKQWKGSFLCPVESYLILVDYGQVKQVDGVAGSRSNSTLLYTLPGASVRAPAAGQVVLARELALTGNTVVIDHGCGMRSYLYGLAELDVKVGDTVERGQKVGSAGEELTMDFKLGSKSVNPWNLFQASGGLFWKEDA